MRLIDGDALKKRVKESTAILSVKVLAETLINTAPTITAVSVPQWISVKDRLPENKTRNIVLRYDHVTKTHFVDILWFCGNGWFCNPLGSGAKDKSISCWMPLPEPPKGENDG